MSGEVRLGCGHTSECGVHKTYPHGCDCEMTAAAERLAGLLSDAYHETAPLLATPTVESLTRGMADRLLRMGVTVDLP